jgi:hypothetical protein
MLIVEKSTPLDGGTGAAAAAATAAALASEQFADLAAGGCWRTLLKRILPVQCTF